MKSEIIKLIIGLVFGIAGTILAFIWLDWKQFTVIFLLLWSNNISISSSIKSSLKSVKISIKDYDK